MTHKILHIGSSAGITIPKELLKELGLRVGDSVELHYEKRISAIQLRPTKARKKKISTATHSYLEEFFKRYDADLKRLARH